MMFASSGSNASRGTEGVRPGEVLKSSAAMLAFLILVGGLLWGQIATNSTPYSGPNPAPAMREFAISFCASGCTNAAITQAQITAFPGTPVVLVPAQGANTMIQLDQLVVNLAAVATPYVGNGTWETIYGTSGTNAATNGCATAFLSSVSNVRCAVVLFANTNSASSGFLNLPISFYTTIAPTCAATCGTLNIYVKGRILSGVQ